jgi:hypothetical protein
MSDGEISLIDCGQVKQITGSFRVKLAKVVILVSEYLHAAGVVGRGDAFDDQRCRALMPELAASVREFGVTFADDVPDEDECAAAVALLLFGTPDVSLPGGYSHVELSNESPIKKVLQFPQELVMLGRATVLIKGIASKLNIPWALADKWADACRAAVARGQSPGTVPIWARETSILRGDEAKEAAQGVKRIGDDRVRFAEVRGVLRKWASSRGRIAATKVYEKLPSKLQARAKARLLRAAAKREEEAEGEI